MAGPVNHQILMMANCNTIFNPELDHMGSGQIKVVFAGFSHLVVAGYLEIFKGR